MENKEMEYVEEKEQKVPAGAEILSTSTRLKVMKIENGYLLCKTKDVKFKAAGSDHSDWLYIEKKWYSKENPMTVNIVDEDEEQDNLADKF